MNNSNACNEFIELLNIKAVLFSGLTAYLIDCLTKKYGFTIYIRIIFTMVFTLIINTFIIFEIL